MSEYAPDAIWALYDTIAAAYGSAVMSGIMGDEAHTYGYHRGRNYVSSSDYSAQQPDDKKGSGEACCGLDIGLNAADMRTMTQRLINATSDNDPRLLSCRSFLGTTDNQTVTGRDVRTGKWITSDPSHLYHEHMSIYRRWADDHDELQRLAAVIVGDDNDAGAGDDMPTHYLLKATDRRTVIGEPGVYYAVGWDDWSPDSASGGVSCALPDKASMFSMTAWLKLAGLPPDGNVYVRVQTLDRGGVEKSKFPVAEVRGTSGDSYLSMSNVGTVPNETNLRLLVAATVPCTVMQAWWRVLHW